MKVHPLAMWLVTGDVTAAEEDGGLAMMVLAGAITAEEADRWRRAIRRVAAGDEGRPPIAPRRADPPADPDPIRGIVAGPDAVHGGIRLTSIVRRTRSTEVRWHATGISESGIDLRLADDLGTRYGTGWSEQSARRPDAQVASGTQRFAAAIPDDAGELRLTWGGATATCHPGAPWPGS